MALDVTKFYKSNNNFNKIFTFITCLSKTVVKIIFKVIVYRVFIFAWAFRFFGK